ncbi:hypothetical protein [Tenacibaculum agarivorans]|uniref:hypothetical protein n=1 Tax=Tenacibaculum agarivorans TaxID=1908389 RepID=UPI000AF3530F|nr:hypothetical protein [Tenacibaculum agarivorans]
MKSFSLYSVLLLTFLIIGCSPDKSDTETRNEGEVYTVETFSPYYSKTRLDQKRNR